MSSLAQDYDGILEEDVYINLSYVGCNQGGYCPHYQITVLGSGRVIFEGIEDVSKKGVFQQEISKRKIADLLTDFFRIRYFERKDESSNCFKEIRVLGGVYDDSDGICMTSNHGPQTEIKVKFGHRQRNVYLEHYYSDDYDEIKEKIIATTGFKKFISGKETED